MKDSVMHHPSDSKAWFHFDQMHPSFSAESRNVRLGLCTDGFQPFGQSGKQYSCWPIIVTPYNLPPGMCMKEPHMFLSVIVPGPNNPKHKIDVFLQPLIAELKHLWEVGVETYDVSQKQNFQMRASLLWTISDFPAYSMLSGWSIFWDLPYWSTNLIRHNLDVMHIEKNVFENVFNTVMNIEGKTKDNIKAREDLVMFCRRKELEKNANGKYPKANYTLDKNGKQAVCEWVKNLKFPDGYVSNMGRCVDLKKYKLFGMKSHDCHVFMQRLIPIAFRNLMPTNVWEPLTELSLFFKDLTCTKLKEEDMRRLELEIPEILCKLERIFPPAFFDSMEHLPVHLPYEARIAGPVQFRWMYPYERY